MAYKGITPEVLDPHLCTHINYAFITVWANGNLKVSDDNLDINQGLYKRVTGLKSKNPKLKVLLSVGGASVSSALFGSIAADPAKRGAFIGSAKHFVSTYKFDGLDIDWEVPQAKDKANYITLLRETKAAFAPHHWMLTAALSANPQAGYNVGEMNKYLDIFNLMTYDYYGPWSHYTGQNSPLFASSVETAWEKGNLNIQASSAQWVAAGVPKHKIAIGTAFYGRTFTLADPSKHGLHAPKTSAGPDSGAPDYVLICTKYNDWTRVWDNQQKNPYKYKGNGWLGYDDPQSIKDKGAWIKSQGFLGAMVWHISGDDVKGACGEKQHLLRELNKSLK